MSVEARIESLEEGLARADRRVQQSSRQMRSFGDVAGNYAARGLRTMSAAMGAVGAAQAAQERQWLSLSAIILANWAAGGPVLGAITAAGAAIGIMFANSEKAADRYLAKLKGIEAETTKLRDKSAELELRIFEAAGGDAGMKAIEDLDIRIAGLKAAREPLAEAARLIAEAEAGSGDFTQFTGHTRKDSDRYKEIGNELGRLVSQRTTLVNIEAGELRLIDATTQADLKRLGILRQFEGVQRAQVEAYLRIDEIMAQIRAKQVEGIPVPPGLLGNLAELQKVQLADIARQTKEVSAELRTAASAASSFAASLIFGSRDAAAAVQALAQQIAQQFIQRGFNTVFGVPTS